MHITEFNESDRVDIIDLWQQCKLITASNDPNKDINRKLTCDPELFLVGRVDGIVMASIMGGYEGHRGWINYLAVNPEYQRRGYAKALMNSIEQRLLERGCPKINLQVRETNEEVHNFYHAIGYNVDPVTSFGKRLVKD